MVSVAQGSTRFSHVPRPDTGSTFSVTPNSRMSIMPTQKLGMERPREEMPLTTTSKGESFVWALRMPSGMATRIEHSSETLASCSVAGIFSITTPMAEVP